MSRLGIKMKAREERLTVMESWERRESKIAREMGEIGMREWNFDRGKDRERGREDACERNYVS